MQFWMNLGLFLLFVLNYEHYFLLHCQYEFILPCNWLFLITITPWFQFYLKTFSVSFERFSCFNKADLIKYMVLYTLCRTMHCALDTDSLCPRAWEIHLMEFIFVVEKPNASCLNTVTKPMYSAQNGFPLYKLQGLISKAVFLIHCAPTPPTFD